jgi:hypothetical protein
MLTLLHTSPAHIARFDGLRDRLAPGAPLTHLVREDLLARARTNGMTAAIARDVAALVSVRNALCTCSTLGSAAEAAGAVRIDRPAMRTAAQTGGHVLMAYCLESTAAPSQALLEEEMANARNTAGITSFFIPGAWPHFEAAETVRFAKCIANEVRAALTPGIACVLLAQASMDGAAAFLADAPVPVFTTPERALSAALAL